MKMWLGLVGWIAVTFLAAAFGAQFMPGAWYAGLTKPSWNPPSWLFGPVWTALYLMMGVSAWMIWKSTGGRGCSCSRIWRGSPSRPASILRSGN